MADHNNDASMTTANGLSSDEMALYDRQIRLWGAHAQERIRSANILLVSLRALGTEIAKSLTLAGVHSITIVDDEIVTDDDIGGAQFFLRHEDVGKPRAEAAIPRIQELNPRVEIQADGSLQTLLTKDQTYYAPFNCVIACDHDTRTLSMINTAARFASRPFYAAGIHGFYGYIFADLVLHNFVIEREKSNVAVKLQPETMTRSIVGVSHRKENSGKQVEIIEKNEIYCPLMLANTSPLPLEVSKNRRKLKAVPALLPCLRALFEFQSTFNHIPCSHADLATFTTLAKNKAGELQLPPGTLTPDFLRSFMHNIGAELNPTAAFVGGRLSEDVINVLGKREQPIQNFALFDGEELVGKIYCLYTTPPEFAVPLLGGQMPGALGPIGLDGFGDRAMLGANGAAVDNTAGPPHDVGGGGMPGMQGVLDMTGVQGGGQQTNGSTVDGGGHGGGGGSAVSDPQVGTSRDTNGDGPRSQDKMAVGAAGQGPDSTGDQMQL